MTGDDGANSVGDRGLIEDAVKLLLAGAPAGWTQLHGEFEPSAQSVVAAVTAATAQGAQTVMVPGNVLGVLAEHQRRAAAAGVPWQRLILDCGADGRLSARTETAKPAVRESPPRRWLQQVLLAITVGCLAAAAVLFAVGWKWSSPPRADVVPVTPPAARQQEAFDVIAKWFDARNRSDAAGMRSATCAHPTPAVVAQIDRIAQFGETQSLDFPDAITKFDDVDEEVWVTMASRVRPLDEHMRQRAAMAQKGGGFFVGRFTLVDDGGGLRVCDINVRG